MNSKMTKSATNAIKTEPKPDDNNTSTSKYIYRDFSHIPPPENDNRAPSIPYLNIRIQKLPTKLDAMLSNPEFSQIITWMPHGRSWKVLNSKAFAREIMPRYFEYRNYNSFTRLVNAWGFRRISSGVDRNSYYHELFLRGMPHLNQKMRRMTANEKKSPLSQEDEPDFHMISKANPLPEIPRSNLKSVLSNEAKEDYENKIKSSDLMNKSTTQPNDEGVLENNTSSAGIIKHNVKLSQGSAHAFHPQQLDNHRMDHQIKVNHKVLQRLVSYQPSPSGSIELVMSDTFGLRDTREYPAFHPHDVDHLDRPIQTNDQMLQQLISLQPSFTTFRSHYRKQQVTQSFYCYQPFTLYELENIKRIDKLKKEIEVHRLLLHGLCSSSVSYGGPTGN